MSSRLSPAAIYPQPTTPLRGKGLLPFCFDDVRLARAGHPDAKSQLRKLFSKRTKAPTGRRFFILKPKRVSRGILWRGIPFYWSPKGYYRPGRDKDGTGPRRRRPLHHQIWASYWGKAIPPLHEVVFLNDDEHDFRPVNLECLHKSEVHRRIIDLKGPNMNKWMRTANSRLAHLLNRSQEKDEYDDTIKFLGKRREEFHPRSVRGSSRRAA